MEIETDIEKHCLGDFLTINYVKLIKNSKELCLICMIDEKEEGKQWDIYSLSCGHQFHTRCLRAWVSRKQKLNCSYCGDIAPKDDNKYCKTCDAFGHAQDDHYDSDSSTENPVLKLCKMQ